MPEVLKIYTLGAFSVRKGDVMISEESGRSQMVWKIFKYLVTNRHKTVTTEELIELLWPEAQSVNPLKLLYIHISRLRRLLQQEGAPEPYILYRQKGYQWNPKARFSLDTEEFERLITGAAKQLLDEEKLPNLRKALELYKGDYLAESASENWVLPVAGYYRRLYLRAVGELADIYARASAYDEVIMLCSNAARVEPYNETLYERMIQALLINGEATEAKRQYQHISELLKREFGTRPSEKLQALYQEICAEGSEKPMALEDVKRMLEGEDARSGAYFCTSDIFRQIYQIDTRSDERMKFPVFLGLITVTGAREALAAGAEKEAMRVLRYCLGKTLRRGDVVSQYSKRQFLVLLSAYLPVEAETAVERVRRMLSTYAEEKYRVEASLTQVGSAARPA